jgi:hypothetical protein
MGVFHKEKMIRGRLPGTRSAVLDLDIQDLLEPGLLIIPDLLVIPESQILKADLLIHAAKVGNSKVSTSSPRMPQLGLFRIIRAAITPGTQPQRVSRNTIKKEPHPLPITDRGGKRIARSTRRKLISTNVHD